MFRTLRLSFSLKNTYKVNSILYAIKRVPLVRRVIPPTVYGIKGFKILANVLSVIEEVLSFFLWKLLYCFIMIYCAIKWYNVPSVDSGATFMHLLLILSVIGALTNTYMFDPSKDKYYAMILLGMDAKEYTVMNYFYSILKVLTGFAAGAFVFGLPCGISVWECFLIPFFVAGVKMFSSSVMLVRYERQGTAYSENKQKKVQWLCIIILLIAAYGLPLAEIVIPKVLSDIGMGIGILLGLVAIHKIVTFQQYRQMYKELLIDAVLDVSTAMIDAQTEQNKKKISANKNIYSERKGFEYLNELFIKRHQSVLWKSVKRISIIIFVFFVVVLIVLQMKPDINTEVNELLMTSLPYMVFIMYFINRGTTFTQILFANCDHCLLSYAFYRQPKNILKLFCIRLREIVKINMLPAAEIGVGLVVLLFFTGGTQKELNYVILFFSVIAMSIFFSVHYLMLYYLLQPYNAGTEVKSGLFQIVTWGTYFICYMMIKLRMPTPVFGMLTVIFCAIYSIVACILVYKFAPKTFKIRD